MFSIRLVTTIVHTVLVVCTIIRPPGKGVALVWTEVLCHLRSCNKCLKREVSEKDVQDQGIAENTTLANTEERLLLTSSFCISITNYLVFLVWSEVSHYFIIIEVVA